jgi:hypothetical protein
VTCDVAVIDVVQASLFFFCRRVGYVAVIDVVQASLFFFVGAWV